jgi:hypothetical protein
MDNGNKLKAPKAVKGFRTPIMNYRTSEAFEERSFNIHFSPEKKGSCLNLTSQISKHQTDLKLFECEKEIIDDFEELSVKSEIFSILREGSTLYDSIDIRNSNPSAKMKYNLSEDCLCGEFEEKTGSPQRIRNPIYKNFNDEFGNEGNNIPDFAIYNTCKKFD